MIYAPVIIPTLNRIDHFKQCLESLEACTDADKTDVYVALDYPPSERYVEGWKKNDEYLKNKEKNNCFKSLTVYRRETNYYFSGKANAGTAIKDATVGLDRYIFSEDDNIFSPNFLVFMNTCLEKYKDDENVIAVCGYSYPVKWNVDENATCFRQQINNSAWGTGYWIDKCAIRDRNISDGSLLKMLPNVIKSKSYEKMIDVCLSEYIISACCRWSYGYKMLRKVTDISMRAYLAVMNKYAITPVVSKVRNIGFDGSGLYCQTIDSNYGDTAGTYNYLLQPIDNNSLFDLIEDSKHADNINRNLLNLFDCRSVKYMRKSIRLLWLCEHLGIWVAKAYCLCVLPFDLFQRVWNKYIQRN